MISTDSEIRRNVELKAHYPDLQQGCVIAGKIGAGYSGLLVQCDTYFHCSNGRLKLREINAKQAELIWYERPDRTESRTSKYQLVPVPDPQLLKQTLAAAWGVQTIVKKRRELYLYRNVRIHLDEVTDLGCFLEFEAVLKPGQSESDGHQLLAELQERFQIADTDLLSGSYGEMMTENH